MYPCRGILSQENTWYGSTLTSKSRKNMSCSSSRGRNPSQQFLYYRLIIGKSQFWPVLAKMGTKISNRNHFYENRSIIAKFGFWPILAKMGTPKNCEISFLMIKTCLVSQNSNRNHFLWKSVNYCKILILANFGKNGYAQKLWNFIFDKNMFSIQK